MLRTLFHSSVYALMLLTAGCGGSVPHDHPGAAPAMPSSGSEAGPSTQEAAPAQTAESGNQADAEALAELAKLPAEDRALAEKQKTCPVTDAPLGSMGVPFKAALKGQTVFLCCEGCLEELDSNADKYLEKLARAETR